MKRYLILMKDILAIFVFFSFFWSNSQIQIKGFVHADGLPLPLANIIEDETKNTAQTDYDGWFELTTINKPSTITIHYIGYESESIEVNKDTIVYVILKGYSNDAHWLSFGGSFEAINSVFGIQVSNGSDEEPLIHFEDFQDDILIKVYGQTDFNRNYSYGAEIGVTATKNIGRTTLKYDVINYEQNKLFLKDFNLTSKLTNFGNFGVIFRMGYEKFNERNRFGVGGGLQHIWNNFYLCINSRYYFGYFHHEAYLQMTIPSNNMFSFKTVYSRIDDKIILSLGLNYTFLRKKN